MKKTIAKHIFGLTGVGILWFIVNQVFDWWFGTTPFRNEREYFGTSLDRPSIEWVDNWDTDVFSDGGFLLLGMLVGYIVIYWAVKTIWFTKDKD